MGTSCCYYTATSEAQKFVWVLGKHGMVLWFVTALQSAFCCKAVGSVNICHRVQVPCLMIASQCRTCIVRHKLLYEIMKWKADLPFCYLICLWETHALSMQVLSGHFATLILGLKILAELLLTQKAVQPERRCCHLFYMFRLSCQEEWTASPGYTRSLTWPW